MPRIAGLPPYDRVHIARRVCLRLPENGHRTGTIGARRTPYRETSRLELPDLHGAGRGGRTLTGLRPKVFETFASASSAFPPWGGPHDVEPPRRRTPQPPPSPRPQRPAPRPPDGGNGGGRGRGRPGG